MNDTANSLETPDSRDTILGGRLTPLGPDLFHRSTPTSHTERGERLTSFDV